MSPRQVSELSVPYPSPATHMSARRGWLTATRLAWAAVLLLILMLTIVGVRVGSDRLVHEVDQRSLLDLGISLGIYAGYVIGINLLVMVVHLAIATIIFVRRPEEPMALFVSFTLLATGAILPLSLFYQRGVADPAWLFLANLIIYLGLAFSVLLLYLFPDARFVPSWTRLLGVSWAALVLPAVFLPDSALSLSTWPITAQILVVLVWAGTGVFAQAYRYQNVSSIVQRQQTKWALVGLTAAVVGPAILLINGGGNGDNAAVPNILYQRMGASLFTFSLLVQLISSTVFRLASVLFPLSFAIAILRYRLLDIDVIINRTLVYVSLTWALLLVYFFMVLVLEWLFRTLTGQGQLAVIVSTMAVVGLFNPLRQRIQDIIDRQFYRRKYDVTKALTAFAASLRDEVDLSTLIERLEGVIEATIQPAHVLTWLRTPAGYGLHFFDLEDPAKGSADVRPANVEIPADDPVIDLFRAASGAVELDKLELHSAAVSRLNAASVGVALPLVSQGDLIGWLSLGPRLSGQGYSADDKALLANLAAQAAPTVRVAQLVSQQQAQALERERIEQELRVARLIQQTLLPQELPSLPGWAIDTYWQPARAVGGDFYDFLSLPDGRLFVAVGDVAGKGIPAALVMATTRAVLRGVARQLLSPGEALERANELLQPELPPTMFVTCLYAILDPASGRLQFANAGHNLPIRWCDDQVVDLRATGMPLGLMTGMHYDEHETMLQPGEGVLLYSDGLVEAHDAEGAMFGFERLHTVMGGSVTGRGRQTVEGLLAELGRFTGPGWEQEDDVTLVTLHRGTADE